MLAGKKGFDRKQSAFKNPPEERERFPFVFFGQITDIKHVQQ